MEIIIATVSAIIGGVAAATGALTKYLYNKRNEKIKLLKENTKIFTGIHHKIIDIINNIDFKDNISTAFHLSNFVYIINQEIQEKYDFLDFLTVYQKENLFPIFKQAENLICHRDYLGFDKKTIKDTSLNNYINFSKEFDNIKSITFSKLEKGNNSFILSTFDAISELFKDIKKEFNKVKINKSTLKELDGRKKELRKAVLVIEKSFIRYKQKQLKD